MCNIKGIIFGATNLTREDIAGKRVIEVGSYDVNGSLRPIIESNNPADYVGVDIKNGPGVDIVCKAEDILSEFGKESFDLVISTELLEHVREWKKVVSNIKNICTPWGIILITTRSFGFQYHSYPFDFWRFEVEDMMKLFSDCIIEKLEKDESQPGVFMKARKPRYFREKPLSDYDLYSILHDKRVKEIDEQSITLSQKMYVSKHLVRKKMRRLMERFIISKI